MEYEIQGPLILRSAALELALKHFCLYCPPPKTIRSTAFTSNTHNKKLWKQGGRKRGGERGVYIDLDLIFYGLLHVIVIDTYMY